MELTNYTKEQFITAQRYLMTMHNLADNDLQLHRVDTNQFDWCGEEIRKTGRRYIGFRQQMRRVVGSSLWVRAYEYLCNKGLLEKHPKYYQYRVTEKGKTYPLYAYSKDEIDFIINSKIDMHEVYVNTFAKKENDIRQQLIDEGYFTSQRWKDLKEEVLEREHYTCQDCGRSKYDDYSLQLDAHHVKYNRAKTDKEIDDLKCLCHSCHEKAHNYKA